MASSSSPSSREPSTAAQNENTTSNDVNSNNGGHHRALIDNNNEDDSNNNNNSNQQQQKIDDPFNIYPRFVRQAKRHFREALTEIQAGRKSSCWSWYFFPVAPWVVNGVERGSWINQEYCLRDLPPNTKVGFDACRAYLRFPTVDGVNLRQNYLDMMKAVGDSVERGVSPVSLVGFLDEPKLRSSLRLFEKVSRTDDFDPEVQKVVSRAMKLMKEEPDS